MGDYEAELDYDVHWVVYLVMSIALRLLSANIDDDCARKEEDNNIETNLNADGGHCKVLENLILRFGIWHYENIIYLNL